jgi:CopG family nickel-responsive transcriptional regulator
MSDIARFSVSLDSSLLERFDALVAQDGYPTRSKAIADLIAGSLIREEWRSGSDVAGVIIMVYDHHKRNLTHELTHTQHDYHELIVSSQHIHLDHHNCLELVVVKGDPARITELSHRLKTLKGVKYCTLSAAANG